MQFCYVGLSAGWQNCHTKRHLELQDIAASHMTFAGVADMSAGPVLVAICMPICPVFY